MAAAYLVSQGPEFGGHGAVAVFDLREHAAGAAQLPGKRRLREAGRASIDRQVLAETALRCRHDR